MAVIYPTMLGMFLFATVIDSTILGMLPLESLLNSLYCHSQGSLLNFQ